MDFSCRSLPSRALRSAGNQRHAHVDLGQRRAVAPAIAGKVDPPPQHLGQRDGHLVQLAMDFRQRHVDLCRCDHRLPLGSRATRAMRAHPVARVTADGPHQCDTGRPWRRAAQKARAFKQEIGGALIVTQCFQRIGDLVVPLAPGDRIRQPWLRFNDLQRAGQKIHDFGIVVTRPRRLCRARQEVDRLLVQMARRRSRHRRKTAGSGRLPPVSHR